MIFLETIIFYVVEKQKLMFMTLFLHINSKQFVIFIFLILMVEKLYCNISPAPPTSS